MVRESGYFAFKEISKELTIFEQTDWHLLPWSQIEKFIFSLQSKIYKVSFSVSKDKRHQLQSFLVSSYAAKLFVVRDITEIQVSEQYSKVIAVFNTLNSSQKLHFALSIDVQSSHLPSTLAKDLIPLYEVASKQLIYLSLRPEWESHSKKISGLRLFDKSVNSSIKSVAFDLNLSQFTNHFYIATLILEKDYLNIDVVLNILETTYDFRSCIIEVLSNMNQGYRESLFSDLDTSQPKVEKKCLEQLLSHILLLNFEREVYHNNKYYEHFKFHRYQNLILCFSDNLDDFENFFSRATLWLSSMGLRYNRKKTRILTKQQSFRFLGFEIVPKFLVIRGKVYSQAYLNAAKEQKKLVLAKARYILRSRRKDGTTRAKTNMPLSKAIALINPLVINWKKHYDGFIPRATQDHLDWLLNEKIYRWYVKRLKKNRVTHWNRKCVQILNNKKRISQDGRVLELFNDSNN